MLELKITLPLPLSLSTSLGLPGGKLLFELLLLFALIEVLIQVT